MVNAINGSTGKEGSGYLLLYEQELSEDGNWVSIFKWGQTSNGASIYDSPGYGRFGGLRSTFHR